MLHDFIKHGRFGHTLYMNMPSPVKSVMTNEIGQIYYSPKSMFFMVGSHASDTFCHPGIAFIMYWLHRRSGGTMEDIFSFKILTSAFILARFWSLFHNLQHKGEIGFWYSGHDVYWIPDLEGFEYAYAAEGISYACMFAYKLQCVINTKFQKQW